MKSKFFRFYLFWQTKRFFGLRLCCAPPYISREQATVLATVRKLDPCQDNIATKHKKITLNSGSNSKFNSIGNDHQPHHKVLCCISYSFFFLGLNSLSNTNGAMIKPMINLQKSCFCFISSFMASCRTSAVATFCISFTGDAASSTPC